MQLSANTLERNFEGNQKGIKEGDKISTMDDQDVDASLDAFVRRHLPDADRGLTLPQFIAISQALNIGSPQGGVSTQYFIALHGTSTDHGEERNWHAARF